MCRCAVVPLCGCVAVRCLVKEQLTFPLRPSDRQAAAEESTPPFSLTSGAGIYTVEPDNKASAGPRHRAHRARNLGRAGEEITKPPFDFIS